MVLGAVIRALTQLQGDVSKIPLIGAILVPIMGLFIAILMIKQLEGKLNKISWALQAWDWLTGLPENIEISMPDSNLKVILRAIILAVLVVGVYKIVKDH
ncbi:MAG: hypothetical protein R2741_02485 [Methanolobus sp.]